MGARGPKPLPANVHRLHGNPSKKTLSELTDALQPEIEVPSFPKHLWPEARKEWKRLAPELVRYGLISRLDRAALALYCQAWARKDWAEQQLARAMQHAAQQCEAHDVAELAKSKAAADLGETYAPVPWAGGDGFMLPTPNGNWAYSPYWVAANKAGDQVEKYLAAFGLSPSSRGRVNPSNRQPDMFDQGDGDSFGSI